MSTKSKTSAEFFRDCFLDCGIIEALEIFQDDIAERFDTFDGAIPCTQLKFKDGSVFIAEY